MLFFLNILSTLLSFIILSSASKVNLLIDTDIFSDVDDAGALLLAATHPNANLLAVNVNTHSAFSALATSAILNHYGKGDIPISTRRPITNETFFDTWSYELGEYTSKVSYHFNFLRNGTGQVPWISRENPISDVDDKAWDPVALYRKTLSETEDRSVKIVSIGFLDNLSALLGSTKSPEFAISGFELLEKKVNELVVMGGRYPGPAYSFNFFGSGPSIAAHTLSHWPSSIPITFLGDEVGEHVLTGSSVMHEKGLEHDPTRAAYHCYGYGKPRASWDPLTVLYAIEGLGEMLGWGSRTGYNKIYDNGTNEWVEDGVNRNQSYLKLATKPEDAAKKLDEMMLAGARAYAKSPGGLPISFEKSHTMFERFALPLGALFLIIMGYMFYRRQSVD